MFSICLSQYEKQILRFPEISFVLIIVEKDLQRLSSFDIVRSYAFEGELRSIMHDMLIGLLYCNNTRVNSEPPK